MAVTFAGNDSKSRNSYSPGVAELSPCDVQELVAKDAEELLCFLTWLLSSASITTMHF